MALTYHQENDKREALETELFKGWRLYKYFTCPRGDLDTHVGSGGTLERGDFLPEAWGGASTGYCYEPMLQLVIPHNEPRTTAQYEIETYWVSVDYIGTYPTDGTTYIELTRTRSIRKSQFARVHRTIGIAATRTDTGIPAVGDYLDGDKGSPLNPVASQVEILDNVHAGRVFVVIEWVGCVKSNLFGGGPQTS